MVGLVCRRCKYFVSLIALVLKGHLRTKVEKTQTLLYRVSIRLSNRSSTFESFKKRFTRLADVYAANWSPQSADAIHPLFVSMTGEAAPDSGSTDPPVRDTVEAGSTGHAHGCGHVNYMAKLIPGHDEEDVNGDAQLIPRGFTGSIIRVAHNIEGPPQIRLMFSKAYACQDAYEALVDADSA